jgi:hypothetical protein
LSGIYKYNKLNYSIINDLKLALDESMLESASVGSILPFTDQISNDATIEQCAAADVIIAELVNALKVGNTGVERFFHHFNRLNREITFRASPPVNEDATQEAIDRFEQRIVNELVLPTCAFDYATRRIKFSSEIITGPNYSLLKVVIGIDTSKLTRYDAYIKPTPMMNHVAYAWIQAFQQRKLWLPKHVQTNFPRFVPSLSSSSTKFRILDNPSYSIVSLLEQDYIVLQGGSPTTQSPLIIDDRWNEESKRKLRRDHKYYTIELQKEDWNRMPIATYIAQIFSNLPITRPKPVSYTHLTLPTID